MSKLVLYIIFGYLIYKASKFVMRIFEQIKPHKEEPKVRQTKNSKTRISDKDIIDAKFEELPPEDNSTSN